LKNTDVAPTLHRGYFFYLKIFVLILTKKWAGLHFWRFLKRMWSGYKMLGVYIAMLLFWINLHCDCVLWWKMTDRFRVYL
jgi:hypothetical protein